MKKDPSIEDSIASLEEDESSAYSNENGSLKESGSSDSTGLDVEQKGRFDGIAKKDTFRIRVVRLIVLAAILLTGTFVSFLTYRILNDSQSQDFKEAFEGYASIIEGRAIANTQGLGSGLTFFSQQITAHALGTGSEFPFETLPMMEVHGSQALTLSNAEWLFYAPILKDDQLDAWANYSVHEQNWIDDILQRNGQPLPPAGTSVLPFVFEDVNGTIVPAKRNKGLYAPIWQSWPLLNTPIYNFNMLDHKPFLKVFEKFFNEKRMVFLEIVNTDELEGIIMSKSAHDALHEPFQPEEKKFPARQFPHFSVMQPVFDQIVDPLATEKPEANVTGMILATLAFDHFFADLIPEGTKPMNVCMVSTLGKDTWCYRIEGKKATLLGQNEEGKQLVTDSVDLIEIDLTQLDVVGASGATLGLFLQVYATNELQNEYQNSLPFIFAIIVASSFLFMAATFFVYDLLVRRRNDAVSSAAAASDAIVTSMFPSNVRDRLYEDAAQGRLNELSTTKKDLSSFLQSGGNESQVDKNGRFKTKPIADLFPETTIMFADLAGFTAWSSTREPSQVFVLLETVYRAFDEIATRRRVYKVETVGDCYVAVCGLPNPHKDHAIVMARFARECIQQMGRVTRQLEIELGPDTTDLDIRVGLHSGAVTAGVLRGERSRFQLFGDTMNTAARMEQTGKPGSIQVSRDTADLLCAAGKESWVEPRNGTVDVKGKGQMQTFWLHLAANTKTKKSDSDAASMNELSSSDSKGVVAGPVEGSGMAMELSTGKLHRLVSWNVDVMSRLLRQIIARRELLGDQENSLLTKDGYDPMGEGVLSEVSEIIRLPSHNISLNDVIARAESTDLPKEIRESLHNLVASLAALYHNNPFHNFEHASHVTMSVTKLLSRIVAPSDLNAGASTLHDHTYGITSDPLTQFACVFSALIHDVDHPGVPNTQLIQEETTLAKFYKNKSVAEQNSVDLAWSLLMSTEYTDLRMVIYNTEAERQRFRQLVVNSVMATDIMDKDLKKLRNDRWDAAFCTEAREEPRADTINRKATIVIEHLIQASDVAHTMQHWHVYRKWNERLFMEMLQAFRQGRSNKHPVEGWYEGEIGFFDFYIIPLAKKLKDCGVFGVSSDEYLAYAKRNRDEWELRGKEVVAEMMEKIEPKEDPPSTSATMRRTSIK